MTFSLSAISCVYIPQDVAISPKINISASDIGKNSNLKVATFDKRENSYVIGRRGNGIAEIAAINNNQNLALILKDELTNGFEKKGFSIAKDRGLILEVSILSLKYKSLFGFFTIGSEVNTSLEAVVKNQNDQVRYKEIYRGHIENRHFLAAPLAETNAKNINISFQKAIEFLLNDEKLLKALKN